MAATIALTAARRERAGLVRKINNVRAIVAGHKLSSYDYTQRDVDYFEGKLAKIDAHIARLTSTETK